MSQEEKWVDRKTPSIFQVDLVVTESTESRYLQMHRATAVKYKVGPYDRQKRGL